MHIPVSLSFSLYLNLQKPFGSRSDPNGIQERMFRQFKNCACDRKYAKCRTKADAHDKIGFQYISISVYIIWSHALIQTPPPPPLKNHKNIEFLDPLKFSKLPSQHSTLGHHRHASETPFKGVSLAGRWWPTFSDICILSPLQKKKKLLSEFGSRSDPNGIQEKMFRQFKHLGVR